MQAPLGGGFDKKCLKQAAIVTMRHLLKKSAPALQSLCFQEHLVNHIGQHCTVAENGLQLLFEHFSCVEDMRHRNDGAAKIPAFHAGMRTQVFPEMLGMMFVELCGPEGFIYCFGQNLVVEIVLEEHGAGVKAHKTVRPKAPDGVDDTLAEFNARSITQYISSV